ncbi:MAG TPA: helix-turn-helix domain-containing protein, partial [Candidatus Wallbacteria bacterium]|nr:helix-turn-helix domain-containing protein [Candidatus Wallbacteria bacterium]
SPYGVSGSAGFKPALPESNEIKSGPELELKKNSVKALDEEALIGGLNVAALAPLDEVERAHIARALKILDWNLSKTARALHIDRKTLYLKIEKYRIEKESY